MCPFVCEVNRSAGFIKLESDGHIDCTYVQPKYAGMGYIPSSWQRVKRSLRDQGIARLFTEVSKMALHFMERDRFVLREKII
ncbi:MAG: GNAT family N-acetyltransferase [Okeania sp. SIO1H5]|nr:GNAT family N-acetyltransferase [Okeania sp. SIO1H5]